MSPDRTRSERRQRRGFATRRSLVALATGGIGALLSLPAHAHHLDAAAGKAAAQSLPDLKKVGAEHQVRAIRHKSGSYRVITMDGNGADFPETDLRFKVDSSAIGPFGGKPVILPAGDVGDRAVVFFAAPDEIAAFITHET
jgi:hypothetical protein